MSTQSGRRQTARGASNGTVIKSAYEKVAEYWMLLAQLESLLGDEKNNEDAEQARTLTGEVAIAVAQLCLAHMLQRTHILSDDYFVATKRRGR